MTPRQERKPAPVLPPPLSRGIARLAAWLVAGLLAGGLASAAATNRMQLRAQLTGALAQAKAPGASWGIQVLHLTNGTEVFSSSPDRLLVPASCTKLFTVALALDRLGPRYRIITPLSAVGSMDREGRLQGDLVWEGRGATDLGRQAGGPAVALSNYVDAVVRAGIREVSGSVVADESWFRTTPYGPGWNWDDLSEAYGAAVSSLTFNDNLARVRVEPGPVGQPARIRVAPFDDVFRVHNRTRTGPAESGTRLQFERWPGTVDLWVSGGLPTGDAVREESVAAPEPARVAARWLREALARRGVVVRQPDRVMGWRDLAGPRASGRWLGAVTSAPMAELVRDCLKPSQNLHAQLLLLQVGVDLASRARAGEFAGEATDVAALAALDQFLTARGIPRDAFAFEEGSGLSRKNVATAAATVRLLRHMALEADPAIRAAWWEALPIAGVDGTLKARFTQGPARGVLRGKTGSLRQVHALAGYVDTQGGDRLVFAIYLNGFVPSDPAASGRAVVDRLAEVLAGYSGRL